MAQGLRNVRVADCDISPETKQLVLGKFGAEAKLFRIHRMDTAELQRSLPCSLEQAKELRRLTRTATKVVNADRDRRRAASRAAPKCFCGNQVGLGREFCARHEPSPDEELAADITEQLAAYRRLHDGLSEMIESGRLRPEHIPDDYQWLCDSLEKLSG